MCQLKICSDLPPSAGGGTGRRSLTGCGDQCPQLGFERTQRGRRHWAVHDPPDRWSLSFPGGGPWSKRGEPTYAHCEVFRILTPTATLGWYLEWRQRAAPRLGFGPVQKTPTSIMRTFHAISGFIRGIPG